MVIAIIALLAAMLMPALTKAREKAYRAVCANNQRQLNIAFNLYAQDWQTWFPPTTDKGNMPEWQGAFIYLPYYGYLPKGPGPDLVLNNSIFRCPSFRYNPGANWAWQCYTVRWGVQSDVGTRFWGTGWGDDNRLKAGMLGPNDVMLADDFMYTGIYGWMVTGQSGPVATHKQEGVNLLMGDGHSTWLIKPYPEGVPSANNYPGWWFAAVETSAWRTTN